jgi:SEC-C motif-containing protein
MTGPNGSDGDATATATAGCPCGSGRPLARCCGPFLGGAPAPTALALMRSRYTAYVRGAIDYLVETQAPETRTHLDRAGIERWSRETRWQGLEILATERGAAADSDGIVEFVARGVTRGAAFAQRERSRFRRDRDTGRWYYVDGDTASAPARRPASASVGRNDPCPCGSGLKHKRCCGK